MGGKGFWQELKQRHVYRVAVAYALVGWLLIQIATQVFPFFKLPDWSVRLIVLAIMIGFPIALVLAWAFDVSPGGGIRRVTSDGQLVLHDRRRGIFVVGAIGVLFAALAGAGYLWWHRAHGVHSPGSSMLAAAPSHPATAIPDSAAVASGLRTANTQGIPIPTKSIAVLPFLNESGNKDQEYFSDGLADDLITAFSQFAGLKVISRDSAFQFRGSKDDSKTIGGKLGVAHLLEGSVQRAGGEVRISATLVNAVDGSTLWSRHYDRPYKDLFALQDAITHDVADALKAKLMTAPGTVVQSDRPPSGNLAAYAAYLQGQEILISGDLQELHDAKADFEQATRLDPHYALAYARLAEWWVGTFRGSHTPAEGQWQIAQAQAAVRTALALDPDLAAARNAHGAVLYNMDFDWYGAESEYRRALQLAPNDPGAKSGLANVLATLGQLPAAIALQRAAVEVNPRSAFGWMTLGSMLIGSGQLDAAEPAFHESLALARDVPFCRWQLVVIAILRGNTQRAISLAREVPSKGGWRSLAVAAAAQVGASRADADAAFQHAIAENADNNGNYQIAELYALRHDPDNMFKYLDRAWGQRDAGVALLLFDPLILRYKDDPRFAAFCKKVGLPIVTDAKTIP